MINGKIETKYASIFLKPTMITKMKRSKCDTECKKFTLMIVLTLLILLICGGFNWLMAYYHIQNARIVCPDDSVLVETKYGIESYYNPYYSIGLSNVCGREEFILNNYSPELPSPEQCWFNITKCPDVNLNNSVITDPPPCIRNRSDNKDMIENIWAIGTCVVICIVVAVIGFIIIYCHYLVMKIRGAKKERPTEKTPLADGFHTNNAPVFIVIEQTFQMMPGYSEQIKN